MSSRASSGTCGACARRAHLLGEVVTTAKLLAGAMVKTRRTVKTTQMDGLRELASALMSGEAQPFADVERLDLRAAYNTAPAESEIKSGARRLCKRKAACLRRPAAAESRRPRKRPATCQ